MSDDLAATLLLQLRLRASATPDTLAGAAGVSSDAAERALAEYDAKGWVRHHGGRLVGWSLTAAGRRHGAALLSAEMDAAGARAAVNDGYRAFLPLNVELLAICTDWQVVAIDGELVPNDHSDAGRDAAVLQRLDALHPRAMDVVTGLAAVLDRFGVYGPRLSEAHERVLAGRTEWLTRVGGSSYHGAWFELHEHLLAVLDRDREHEPVPSRPPTTSTP